MKRLNVAFVLMGILALTSCRKVENEVEIAEHEQAMIEEANVKEIYEEKTEKPEEEIVEINTIEEVNEYMVAEQTFDVWLEDWENVKFVSCVPGYYDFTDASFFLLKDEQIVYKFPHRFADNSLKGFKGVISEVGAVAFRDINNDDKKDIIIINYYVSGAGSTGMEPRPGIRIYLAGENEFYLAKDMIKEVEDNIEEKDISVQSIYKYLLSGDTNS